MTRRCLLQTGFAVTASASLRPDTIVRRIFNRINELRGESGVEALLWSGPLARCATEQSLRKDRLRFPGHNDPERGSVSQRLQAAGIPWVRCGENIFSERGYADPVHFAVVSWWYSPGHQENLLNPEFTQTGVGVAESADGTFFVTQIFVHPPPIPPKPVRR
ncbi:MAG: hypothetical protein QOJ99_1244 [Bryobacterales bacterium]|jgi:uncharacterized protein YkwD|nr:hypothetical protein [Bryobacterales bacterium]